MENLDPPPSPQNQGWENGAFLPFARLHPGFGGGGGGDGGLLFHFILSKIVVCYTAVFSVVTQRSSPLGLVWSTPVE